MVSPKRRPLPPISTAGSMSEVNLTIWPVLYGVTGHAVGSLLGMGVAGAIVGVVLGFVTGIVMMGMHFMDIEAFAPMAFVPIVIFVPAPVKVWLMGAVCLSAWVRMIPRAVAGGIDAKTTRRQLAEIEACTSPNKLVPFLGDDRHSVVMAASERLYSLRLMHAKVAKVLLKHADALNRPPSVDYQKCRWLGEMVMPLAEAGADARDALLDLYANLGWLGEIVGNYNFDDENADILVENVLFGQLEWENDDRLMEVTERRMSQGWSVDVMVDRLLDTDIEAGLDLAERAFLSGSLSARRLDALGDGRAGALLRKAVDLRSETHRPKWDDIIAGALARPTNMAFTLVAAALRTEDESFNLKYHVDNDFVRPDDGHLSRRHEAPDEAAELLDVTRSRIASLEGRSNSENAENLLRVLKELEEKLTG